MTKKYITKAEILWTRLCPLKCSFCAMPNDTPRVNTDKMIQGLRHLRNLGCQFVAIYGASPLYDMDGLDDYIREAEGLGIKTTIITDGIVKDHKGKIQTLYDAGLRSLTMSYDFVPYDKWSKLKTDKAIDLISWFIELPDIRDGEIVATVTAQNWQTILEQLPDIDKRIWFSFDFVHFDRGNPGTKVQGYNPALELSNDDVRSFCSGLLELREQGVRVHQSEPLLRHLVEFPYMVTQYAWKCHNNNFPSWLTIDADGTVLPCDDFHTDRRWKVWELTEEKFEEFTEFYAKEIETKCAGCFWSTHYDASLIKEGVVPFENYIHV